MIWHNHVATKRGAKIFDATLSIDFESVLCFSQIRNCSPITSAKCDKVNGVARKDYLQTLGAAFDHARLYQIYSEQARRLPPQIFEATPSAAR